MEKYIINGVEVEFDTFDLDCFETLSDAAQRVEDGVNEIQSRKENGEPSVKLLREQANLFLDFFDDVLGDGSAHKIFGGRVNILDIATGYKEFTDAVAAQQKKLTEAVGNKPMNREQRRAARNKR